MLTDEKAVESAVAPTHPSDDLGAFLYCGDTDHGNGRYFRYVGYQPLLTRTR